MIPVPEYNDLYMRVYEAAEIGILQWFKKRRFTNSKINHIQGMLEKTRQLIELGFEVDEKNDEGDCALHLAAANGKLHMTINTIYLFYLYYIGHEDVVKLLLENGADANCRGKNLETPLFNAAYYGKSLSQTNFRKIYFVYVEYTHLSMQDV